VTHDKQSRIARLGNQRLHGMPARDLVLDVEVRVLLRPAGHRLGQDKSLLVGDQSGVVDEGQHDPRAYASGVRPCVQCHQGLLKVGRGLEGELDRALGQGGSIDSDDHTVARWLTVGG
jgi:hypothetical protein